jgi:hypothetical protein
VVAAASHIGLNDQVELIKVVPVGEAVEWLFKWLSVSSRRGQKILCPKGKDNKNSMIPGNATIL